MPSTTVVPDAARAGEVVAQRVADLVRHRPHAVVGVATGSSPLPVYAALAAHVRDGLDVSRVTWVALDEYLDLPPGHPQSYREVLRRELVEPLGLDPATLAVPDAADADPHAAARRYEQLLAGLGGVDLQLLGIGANGHLGFNEPGTPFDSLTHVAALTARTRADNARFFDSPAQVPHRCLTVGLATIARARRLELVATGTAKAEAVAAALHGPVDPACPASLLQRHPSAAVTLDRAAAARLPGTRPGRVGPAAPAEVPAF